MNDQGMFPYGGDTHPSSGHAGSDTSKARAARQDAAGTTAGRWHATDMALAQAGIYGVTFKELCAVYGWHHGQASGVLSTMHKAGRIARLKQTRERCKVYVALNYVGGREVEGQGQTATTSMLAAMYDLLNDCVHPDVWQGLRHYVKDGPQGLDSDQWYERANDVMRRYEHAQGRSDER